MNKAGKELETASFIAHTTRGIVRDRKTRRTAMFAVVLLALVMMIGGSTFLTSVLDPREHPARFIVFWLACAWVTVSALLIALFDALMVRRDARRLRENLQRQLSADSSIDSPTSADGQ